MRVLVIQRATLRAALECITASSNEFAPFNQQRLRSMRAVPKVMTVLATDRSLADVLIQDLIALVAALVPLSGIAVMPCTCMRSKLLRQVQAAVIEEELVAIGQFVTSTIPHVNANAHDDVASTRDDVASTPRSSLRLKRMSISSIGSPHGELRKATRSADVRTNSCA